MNVDQKIQDAVKPVIPVCVPKQYGGDAMEYCVYNYTEVPVAFGNNRARAIRYIVQVHWLFPWQPNISADSTVQTKKTALRNALEDAGFTCPTVTPAGDEEWEHFVFECEIAGGR